MTLDWNRTRARIDSDLKRLDELHLRPTPPTPPTRPTPDDDLPSVRLTAREGIYFDTGSDRSAPIVRDQVDGLETRVYRTTAGGVTRVVVALAQDMRLALFEGLRIEIEGVLRFNHADNWVLDPGQIWCRSFYVNGDSGMYWAAAGRDHFKPLPAWASSKLELATIQLINTPYIGPFQPGLQSDPNGSGGGGDMGVGANSTECWLSAGGFALHALEMEQVIQRQRCFHMDAGGEPEHFSHKDGYWVYETPDGYNYDADLAKQHWPQHGQMKRLRDFDGQHYARCWKSAAILKDIDLFAAWVLSHASNRSDLQWLDYGRDHMNNGLYKPLEQILGETREAFGSPSLGRAGCHAAQLALIAESPAKAAFTRLLATAHRVETGEIHADPSPGYAGWARHKLGDIVPLSMNHEMTFAVVTLRMYGFGSAGNNLADLINPPGGKAKVFGENRWANPPAPHDHPNPYSELQSGNFTEFTPPTVEGFLAECEKRSALGSDQPLFQCPREFWEVAL